MDLNPENEDSSSSSSSSSATSSKSEMSLLNEIWNTSSGSSAAASDILDFLSEDECTIENQPIRKERVCIKNYCEEVVPEYSDKKFLRQFRLERDTVNKLIIRYSQSKYCVVLNCKFHVVKCPFNLEKILNNLLYISLQQVADLQFHQINKFIFFYGLLDIKLQHMMKFKINLIYPLGHCTT